MRRLKFQKKLSVINEDATKSEDQTAITSSSSRQPHGPGKNIH